MLCKHFYFKSCLGLRALLNLLMDHEFIHLSHINNLNKPWCFKAPGNKGFYELNHNAAEFQLTMLTSLLTAYK